MRTVIVGLILLMLVPAALAKDTLVVLSPHPEGIHYEFMDNFRSWYQRQTGRDVDVQWLDHGGTSSDLRFIQAEFKTRPDGIGVDVFFGGGTDPYIELKRLGLLESYKVPDDILDAIAPDINGVPLYDTDYAWYAATMAGFGIIYNSAVIERMGLPQPKVWEDLARPELFGWVGSGDPRKSGSVHMCYEIILQAYGWERGWQIITALGANVRCFSAGGGQTARDAAVGEIACGVVIDFYAWYQIHEAGQEFMGYVQPQNLTIINGDAMAILKGAPNREVAQAFIRFVLSEEGQQLWLLPKGSPGGPKSYDLARLTVRPDLYDRLKDRALVSANPFAAKSKFTYDPALGSSRYNLVNDLIGTFVIDLHERLAASWARAIKQGTTETEIQRLAAMPLTELEATKLIQEGKWKDAFRARTMLEWTRLAASRYEPATELPVLLFALALVFMYVYMRRRSRA